MDEKRCSEMMKRVDERIAVNIERLNNHSKRLSKVENYQSKTEVQIGNLIKEIETLVSMMKWFTTSIVAGLAGFFFWYVKTL